MQKDLKKNMLVNFNITSYFATNIYILCLTLNVIESYYFTQINNFFVCLHFKTP